MSVPFAIREIGQAVVHVVDLDRSNRFHTEVPGFQVSDVHPGTSADAGPDRNQRHLAFELRWGVDQFGSGGRARPWDAWRQTARLEAGTDRP